MNLLKENHPQQDFFIPDMFDNLGASFKDDMASMSHPIFVLSKKKDLRCLEYRKENITVTIAPSIYGLPTIFDKDILLYCASLLMTEINEGRTPPRTLRISCRDLLITTNRTTDGRSYERLKMALDRLRGVSIKTNIKTNKREATKGFGVIDSYEVIESSKVKNRMVRLEITLSEWFYNSLIGKEVVTINRDYFRLGKPLERRLYEIARKFCGTDKPTWSIGLMNLMERTGSTGTLRKFRYFVKEISNVNHLPDYSLSVNENDVVTFKPKPSVDDSQQVFSYVDKEQFKDFDGKTIARARDIVNEAGTGWSFDAIVEQFASHMQKNGNPNNINGAFIGFVKKKVAQKP
jgi:plasmid replication initiation protein